MFRVRHPEEPFGRATYGWDGPSGSGFFAYAITSSGEFRYDARAGNYRHDRPLDGALRFLAARGFYTIDELEEALEGLLEHVPAELPKRLQRVARVIVNFKKAAD